MTAAGPRSIAAARGTSFYHRSRFSVSRLCGRRSRDTSDEPGENARGYCRYGRNVTTAKARLSALAVLAEAELAPPPGDDLRRHSGYVGDAIALLAVCSAMTTAAAHLDVAVLAVAVLEQHRDIEMS